MLASVPFLTFAWNNYVVGGLTLVFLIVCVVMLLTILIQKPQGGGLTAAFGAGASSGQTAFGAKTGDALTIFTIIIFIVYLALAVVLNWAAKPQVNALEPDAMQSVPSTTGATPSVDPATTPATSDPVTIPPVLDPSAVPATVDPAATPTVPPAPPVEAPAVQPGSEPVPAPTDPAPANPTPANPAPTPPGR